ncbi:hypothetical protein N9N28_13045 [Rubripirellula amarantea]|nr:hypothetical protein [Rubripirellula amarantea]
MTVTLTPSLRKAAVLLRSLDADSATVLLSQLSADEAREVRKAMRELGDVDPDEQAELRDALRGPQTSLDTEDHGATKDGGVELAFSTELAAEPELGMPDLMPTPTMLPSKPAADQPFSWLEGGDLPSLAVMLEREHLSTVAVVLSHLPPDRASLVLGALPPSRRAAALQRLADLGESDRGSLDVIEQQLADWIAAQKAERQRRADRLQVIQGILRHSSGRTCDTVLAEIARHDHSLASEIGHVHATSTTSRLQGLPTRPVAEQASALWQPPKHTVTKLPPRVERAPRQDSAETEPPAVVSARHPQPTPIQVGVETPTKSEPTFRFEQIADLHGRQIAELFRHCPVEYIVLALAGASDSLSRKIERMLPKNVAKELRRRMHSLESVRLSELEAAQDQLAETAARLFTKSTDTSQG